QKEQDPIHLMQAHWILEMTAVHQGEFNLALEHLRAAMSWFDSSQQHACLFHGPEPGWASLGYAALALWSLGYPAQALARADDALARARGVSHDQRLCGALHIASMVHQRRGEALQARHRAEEMIALAGELRFPTWVVWGTLYRGWAQVAQGEREEGLAQMRQA